MLFKPVTNIHTAIDGWQSVSEDVTYSWGSFLGINHPTKVLLLSRAHLLNFSVTIIKESSTQVSVGQDLLSHCLFLKHRLLYVLYISRINLGPRPCSSSLYWLSASSSTFRCHLGLCCLLETSSKLARSNLEPSQFLCLPGSYILCFSRSPTPCGCLCGFLFPSLALW